MHARMLLKRVQTCVPLLIWCGLEMHLETIVRLHGDHTAQSRCGTVLIDTPGNAVKLLKVFHYDWRMSCVQLRT